MHAELKKFFDVHRDRTASCKRGAHDKLAHIMKMCDEVDAHINTLQSALTAAELASHDHRLDPKMGWMHTRLVAARERSAAFRTAGRDLAHSLREVESSFDQDEIDIARGLAAGVPELTGARAGTTVS